jgi:hypothetical protein
MISEPIVHWLKSCTYLAPRLTRASNRPKWDFTWPTSLRSSNGCVQNYFWAYGMFNTKRAPILHQLALSLNELNRVSTWASSPKSTTWCFQNDFWAYGMFGANCTTIFLWHQHYLQTDQNKIPYDPRHHGVQKGASKMISEAVVRLAQPMHQSVSRLALSSNGLNWASTWASSPRSTIGSFQNDFWA